jgi:hypothetical protein
MRTLARVGLIWVFLSASVLNGCATIFSSGPQTLNITSDPSGATYQYGVYSGKTPSSLQASRAELAHVATFTLPGYETATVPVDTGIQGSTWWDILFPIGFAVDFASGNAYKVENPNVSATLTPAASASPAAAATPAPQTTTSGSPAAH